MKTTFKEIEIRRRYWQCRCGSDGGYLADDILGLQGRHSRVLQKHACRLAADVSFAKSSEHIEEMLLVKICPETLRTIVENHGAAMARFQPTDTVSIENFQKAEGEVEFTIDAGKVNTCEDGWKDLKIGVIQKRKSGEPIELGNWDKERLPAPTARLAFARIASIKSFSRDWPECLRRLGVDQWAELHVLGDGASWIWKAVERKLTGCVQTLDIYHASERLSKAAKRLFGEGTVETKAAFERGRALLIANGWQGVCQWIGEYLIVDDITEQERRRKVLEGVTVYFSKHTTRLNYAERLASGRAIGSGAVEGEAKTLGLRLKARGARWRRSNVRSMSALVCGRYSDHWEAYWTAA